jgi:hypothetical protein
MIKLLRGIKQINVIIAATSPKNINKIIDQNQSGKLKNHKQ